MTNQADLFGVVKTAPDIKEKKEPPLISIAHCPKCGSKLDIRTEDGFYYFEHCNRVWNAVSICSECENENGKHDIFCSFNTFN